MKAMKNTKLRQLHAQALDSRLDERSAGVFVILKHFKNFMHFMVKLSNLGLPLEFECG